MSIGMPLKIHGATVGVQIQADNASQIPFRVRSSAGSDLLTINGDGTVTGSTSLLGVDQTVTVTITAAEVIALKAAPKTLVAAPGAGKMLEFVSAVLLLDHAGTGFTENADNCTINYTDGSGVVASQTIESTGFIDQTADTATNVLPKINVIAAATAIANKALVLYNPNDEFADGGTTTSVIRAKVTYRVHSTGW
jgi:hypothetical protein